MIIFLRACSSAWLEHYSDKVGVHGSNPCRLIFLARTPNRHSHLSCAGSFNFLPQAQELIFPLKDYNLLMVDLLELT